MTLTAVATRDPVAPSVTPDQMDLIRRTIAQGATDDELKLYLFDCARQGVHPLDKLVHFTKRSGKYTPITSIDFMRIRAADTGEMAGSDDPVFYNFNENAEPIPYPVSATVTVYRLTQGQRFSYTATARWSEYKPETNDFMWRKMPHTMLGKCAEALALRKGFPRQLAGLYAKEELDQSDGPKIETTVHGVEAPKLIEHPPGRDTQPAAPPVPRAPLSPAAATGETRGPSQPSGAAPPAAAALAAGTVRIAKVDATKTKNPKVTKYLITTSTGETYSTIKDKAAKLAEECQAKGLAVRIAGTQTRWGLDLENLEVAEFPAEFPDDEPPF